jgi:hypothetical protein
MASLQAAFDKYNNKALRLKIKVSGIEHIELTAE